MRFAAAARVCPDGTESRRDRRLCYWLNLALVPGELSSLFGGGGPAGEEFEAVGCGGVGWCGVDEQGQSRVGRELHGFEVEVECADDGVVEFLVAGAVEPDVVGGPAGAEVFAAGGEFAAGRVVRASICGSDLHPYHSMPTTPKHAGQHPAASDPLSEAHSGQLVTSRAGTRYSSLFASRHRSSSRCPSKPES